MPLCWAIMDRCLFWNLNLDHGGGRSVYEKVSVAEEQGSVKD